MFHLMKPPLVVLTGDTFCLICYGLERFKRGRHRCDVTR